MGEDEQAGATAVVNQVRLCGRVAAEPVERVLPSGAHIVSVRLILTRDQTAMTRGSQQKSDWVECSGWSAALRRKMDGWQPGDIVSVEGALRRRHYRHGGGSGSVIEIEVLAAKRTQRAPVTV
ncbi:single-stranded DNA-binding protein [Nocardioides mangrovicus]|uniref:Single-stranded DNA-binding protein n=1 Tax=Nocardioides mangrovicus TaxID=2478913 RepID=A0A3L8P5S7_9ACTN|nr:single-stranded DNA-binding protein [Nocardioides mangrovicus]RLV50287.1 single-stranded DNA-binding protein [Nocardioides mangrovicus]